MRKTIETLSTLALWAVWLIGSSLAVFDFLSSPAIAEKISQHLWIVASSPLIAISVFTVMLIAVRHSKTDTSKKLIPLEHNVQWTVEDLANAQNGKVVDLYFAGTGLACQVVARNEAASELHIENQTMHVTVSSQTADESVINLLHKAF